MPTKHQKEVIALAKEQKTNVMRILDKAKIPYTAHYYEHNDNEPFDGVGVAKKLSQDPALVYKTLVTEGKSKEHYVFVIPVAEELNLKEAASSVSEKSVEMIHVKDINKITGYIRGGCSPIGMKKQFKTVIDSAAESLDKIVVSGGKIGTQVELSPKDLSELIGAKFHNITM